MPKATSYTVLYPSFHTRTFVSQTNNSNKAMHLRQWGGAGLHELFSLRPIKDIIHEVTILTETNKRYNSRSNARSDHAVLDFLVTFFIKKKGKNNNYL